MIQKKSFSIAKSIVLKSVLLFTILIFLKYSVVAQTMYEFKYNFSVNDSSIHYKAFLTRYNDGSGFFIVRSRDMLSGFSNSAVRMEFEEQYGKDSNGKTDSSLIILRSVDAKAFQLNVPAGNTGINENNLEYLNYLGAIVSFKKNTVTKYFEPVHVFSPSDIVVLQAEIKEARLLNKAMLSERFISQFFNSSDPFYQFIIQERNKNIPTVSTGTPKGAGSNPQSGNHTSDRDFDLESAGNGTRSGNPRVPSTQNPKINIPGTVKTKTKPNAALIASRPKLFLIIVANTNDVSIGSSCIVDKNSTYKTFQQIAGYLKIKFVPKIIFGKTYSKKNVDIALKSILPAPNDIVVFYYSGHGFNKTEDEKAFPNLDLRTKSFQPVGGANALNIEDVFEQIKKKGARLNLVFSDCCNSDPGLASNTITDIATTRTVSLGWKMENCEALFMSTEKQSILMTAAAKGELSAGNTNIGGIFTFNFRESLEKYMGPFYQDITWNEVMKGVAKQTISKASRTLCPQSDNTYKPCAQTPVFKTE